MFRGLRVVNLADDVPEFLWKVGRPAKAQLQVKAVKPMFLCQAKFVEALLERHNGNVTKSSEAAGVSRKHLYSLIESATGHKEE